MSLQQSEFNTPQTKSDMIMITHFIKMNGNTINNQNKMTILLWKWLVAQFTTKIKMALFLLEKINESVLPHNLFL